MPWENVVTAVSDGPLLSAANRGSAVPTHARAVLPNNFFYVGRRIRFTVSGRITCVVTTPGTARWDICMGSAGTTVVFDTGAINLNVVGKIAFAWQLYVELTCVSVGASTGTTFWPNAWAASEAFVGAPTAATGGNTFLNLPVGTPAAGAGMDNTAASAIDLFYTQTVGTGSQTVHNYSVDVSN